MRQFSGRALSSVLLAWLLSMPALGQEKAADKPPDKPAEPPPSAAAPATEKGQPVPQYTIAGLALMLVLTIVCMPTRKNY